MSSECPSPFSRLSQEIIDKIIDHIADNSPRFLGFVDRDIQHCALVSRFFRPRSEFYIFDSLYVQESTEARQRKLQTLMELMRVNPKIADYIQELSLECVDFEYSWIGEDPIFLDIMRAVSRPEQPLRKLTFKADKSFNDGYGVHRFDNNTEFQPLLDNFFRPFIFPFITTLVLERVKDVPLEVVESCVNLVDLDFDHVKLTGKPSKTALDSTRPALKRLSLHRSRPPLWDTCPVDGWDAALDLSQLQYLAVYKDKLLDFEFEQHIVDVAGASLQELHLPTWRPEAYRGCEGFINLQNSPNVCSLHADIYFPEDDLRSMNRILKTIQTSGSLHTVSIRARVGVLAIGEPEILLNADWETFCVEVIRVRSEESFTIMLWMDYAYGRPTDMELSVFRDQLNRRCNSILSRLLEEKVASLVNSPGCANVLSHTIHGADYY